MLLNDAGVLSHTKIDPETAFQDHKDTFNCHNLRYKKENT